MHMIPVARRGVGVLLAGWTVSAGCAGSGGPAPGSEPEPSEPSLERLEAIYQARADSALMDVHPADVRFMTGMIAHHAQAVLMSSWVPSRTDDPSLRTLAGRITNAQRDEIALMQRWLRDRGRPVPEVGPDGRMPGGAPHDAHMAGMLTPEQLDELEAARGAAFDRLFLTYMIQHHQGAVTMVHDLFATDGAALDDLVFKLASDIQVDQRTEVARMQGMLDAMPER